MACEKFYLSTLSVCINEKITQREMNSKKILEIAHFLAHLP